MSSARLFSLNATKEIILSAGAINTPQLLLLSGLGPAPHLASLGIPLVLDHPDIGQHLSDHPLVGSQFFVTSAADDVIDPIARNATLLAELLAEWNETHAGFLAGVGTNQVGWLRIPDGASIWDTYDDPSAGPTSPHYELLFTVSVSLYSFYLVSCPC